MVAPSCGNQRKRRTDVVLEITTDDSPLDLVAARFDAGIHRVELIERHHRGARVAQPTGGHRRITAFTSNAPTTQAAARRANHRCINISMGSAGVYGWEFEKGLQSLAVGVQGSLVIDDMDMTVRAAMDGIGLALSQQSMSRRILRAVRWCASSRICA